MQHLPLPVTAAADEAEVNKLAKKAYWLPHQARWIAAYRTYQANGGSPFAVVAQTFDVGVGDRQYELYDNRKNSGELKRMRKRAGLKSCPVCGSPVTGSLDHYLPRTLYREFSIMRANLIPACGHCNSSTKGVTVHGGPPRRFIHPYYDVWAAGVLWFVEVIPPFAAARFQPRPIAGLPHPQDDIVAFHLANVLGTQFGLSMDAQWASLPGQIKVRDPHLTIASVTTQLEQELRVAQHAGGTNCWAAALLRGILASDDAIEYLREQALMVPEPPFALGLHAPG